MSYNYRLKQMICCLYISKNTVSLLRSCEITCKNETRDVNNKLNRVKSHLSDVYRKLNVYSKIITNNKNSQFT